MFRMFGWLLKCKVYLYLVVKVLYSPRMFSVHRVCCGKITIYRYKFCGACCGDSLFMKRIVLLLIYETKVKLALKYSVTIMI